MNQFDIRSARISYEATALMHHASEWRNAKFMSLAEVDLIAAERHLNEALEDVRHILSELRKERKERA